MPQIVYRSVGAKRRTSVPRASNRSAGMSTAFGRMLAKLALASEELSASRRRRHR